MQNLEDTDSPTVKRAKVTEPSKPMTKISNTRYLNQNIYTLFLQKRYQQCQHLISRSPPDEFKLYIKAMIEKQQFKLEGSLSLLGQCQAMNKLNFTYLKAMAKNFYLLGKYKSSLEVAKDAYKLNSSESEIFYIMGKISLALKDVSNAITHFKHSINKEPNEESYVQLSKIHYAEKRYIDAAQTVKEALNVSSQNPQLFEILGQIYLVSGHKDEAKHYFKQALDRDSQRYNSILPLGTLLLQQDDMPLAMEYFRKAHKISPNSAVLWNNLGMFMFKKKKSVSAYSCLKRALFLDPFRWDIHANLALVMMGNKKYLAAHIHLRSAIQIQSNPNLFNLLGICLAELKDFNNAELAFEQALSDKQDEDTHYNYLTCLLKAGKKDKAKKVFEDLSSSVSSTSVREKLFKVKPLL